MYFKLFTFVLICFAENIDCSNERYDYKYFPEIEGSLKFNIIPAPWSDARVRCNLEGAELVSPLNDAFISTLKSISQQTIWTGVNALYSKGYYFSVSGIPILRMPISWAPGQPDNYGNEEQCIAMTTNGTFADDSCENMHPYFCYRKKTAPTEVNACGTDDPGYVYYTTGSCYKFHNYAQDWERAFTICAAEGAHLAIMKTATETQLLTEIFASYPPDRIHQANDGNLSLIGIKEWDRQGLWTVHGESLDNLIEEGVVSYENTSNLEHYYGFMFPKLCGSISREGCVKTVSCNTPYAFICEKLPNSLL